MWLIVNTWTSTSDKYLQVHVTFQRVLSEQIPDDVQRLRQSPRQRPHGWTFSLPVHDRGSGRQAFRPEPQLARKILLHHVIRELHPKVPVRPALRYQFVHYLAAYRQHLVLAMAQLIDQRGASFRLLAAVERVQLAGNGVQRFVGVEKLREQTRVVPLWNVNVILLVYYVWLLRSYFFFIIDYLWSISLTCNYIIIVKVSIDRSIDHWAFNDKK